MVLKLEWMILKKIELNYKGTGSWTFITTYNSHPLPLPYNAILELTLLVWPFAEDAWKNFYCGIKKNCINPLLVHTALTGNMWWVTAYTKCVTPKTHLLRSSFAALYSLSWWRLHLRHWACSLTRVFVIVSELWKFIAFESFLFIKNIFFIFPIQNNSNAQ